MRTILLVIFAAFAAPAFSQHVFTLRDASKYFDIRVTAEECDDGFCRGKGKFEFFRKNGTRPYQVIEHEETLVQLADDGAPSVNVTMLYDVQSVVNVGDFNFDGMEDVAICDGANGSYGGPSYRIYLSNRQAGKFVHSAAFTSLGSHLGMFQVDAKRKRLRTFDKSGCCWHVTEEYAVAGNRPVKMLVIEEDATIADDTKVKITMKERVGGKWRVKVKYLPR